MEERTTASENLSITESKKPPNFEVNPLNLATAPSRTSKKPDSKMRKPAERRLPEMMRYEDRRENMKPIRVKRLGVTLSLTRIFAKGNMRKPIYLRNLSNRKITLKQFKTGIYKRDFDIQV